MAADDATIRAAPPAARRRRSSLRWRITIAFLGGALAVSALVAGTTYVLAERSLRTQRVQASIQQSYGNIAFALQYVAQPPPTPDHLSEEQRDDVILSKLVEQLGTRGTFETLILRGRQPFSSSFSITPGAVPRELARVVARGDVGYVFTDARRQLVVGSPLPGREGLVAYFFYRADDLLATLGVLRSVLLGVSAVAVLLAAAVGTRVSRRVVDPVRRVSDAARRVAEGLLETRLPAGARDELGRLAESFNEMAAALEDRIGRERRFVGDVSHELRTPLTTLRTSTDYLLSHAGDLPPSLKRATELLAADVAYLQDLVHDLLDVSRAEAGRVDMAWERVNLAELAREVVARRVRTDDQRVRVLVNTDPEALATLADKQRLERIVGNLVDNALVHGEGADVTIRVARRDGELLLTVEDEGPGIPRAAVGRVFERFYKTDPSRQRGERQGSGLGLAIARENAHLHGGEIEVDSDEGRGSRFTLLLPMREGEPA